MQLKVLVADDEKNVRRSIQLALEDAGFKAILVENAFQVQEACRKQDFDLLVLDIRMGEIDGLEALGRLRREGVTTPVLFVSGNASLSEAVQAIRAGGADFLEKPFTSDQLLLSVERALRVGELERKARQESRGRAHGLW